MDRRTRICVWIILIGLANFLAYTVVYLWIGGEAVNGRAVRMPDGQTRYYLQSWQDTPPQVSRGLFIYSGIHSISIWPTVGAILLAMLTLAKDRLVSSMRSTVVRGRTLITILATIITVIVVVILVWFILVFVHRLTTPLPPGSPAAPAGPAAPAAVAPLGGGGSHSSGL